MPIDTGARLRSLYKTKDGVADIFSGKVVDYIASRPDYPASLFDTLANVSKLQANASVADIGAGTGLLTRGLLARGYRVTAIEPNEEMRKAADCLLFSNPKYHSLNGTAEAIPLESSSMNLITAAQAFHWFDVEKARKECLRVLVPDGQVALIWNDRVLKDPMNIALEGIFTEFGGEKRSALVAHEERRDVSPFFGSIIPVELKWPHQHELDEKGLVSLVFSRSYIPDRETSLGRTVRERVAKLFRKTCVQGRIAVRYTTTAIIGRPAG